MLLKLFNLLIFFTLIIITANQFTQYESTNHLILNDKINSKFVKNIINNQSLSDKHHEIDEINFHHIIDKSVGNRVKRETISQRWITKEFKNDDTVKMHAFVVRDEEIPPCCTAAKTISQTRHFMCSGSMLTTRHAITSASCMHFADVYEHHIEADLAILIGAFSKTPYVIKINRYEMHPNYVYDVNSSDFSTHDLAILFLNCSILTKNMNVPRLPKGFYEDIGHLCCGKKCELMTVIQNANNHHVAKILTAKYLPLPVHDETRQKNSALKNKRPKISPGKFRIKPYKKHNVSSSSSGIKRVRKSTGKLAGTPSFLLKTAHIATSYSEKKNISEPSEFSKYTRIRNIFDEIENARREMNDKNEASKKKKASKSQKMALSSSKVDEELVTSINWKTIEEKLGSKISDENREKMEKFTKKLVDVTMKRLDSVVDSGITRSSNKKVDSSEHFGYESHGSSESNLLKTFLPHGSPGRKNYNITDFALAFAKILRSVAVSPNNGNKLIVSSDLIVDEKDLGPPPPKYVECPPLGTPIFRNGVLIAMISYTCDDAQNWVEWKYVSISRNMNWIRRRISTAGDRKPIIKCT